MLFPYSGLRFNKNAPSTASAHIIITPGLDSNAIETDVRRRNNVGHYLGRTKNDYSAPLLFSPISATRISHKRILKYFKLVNDVAKQVDLFLKEQYIGSYDIMFKRCFFTISFFYKHDAVLLQ